VVIVAPEAGCVAAVGDVLDVLVVAREGLEIASVAVLCDARGVGMLQAPPYAFKWDTAGLDVGDHVLRAFAYLKSGERLGAEPVVVTLTGRQRPAAVETKGSPTVLKEGTLVLLQTEEKMVSGHTPEGAAVRYKVVRDVVAPGGQLLVAYGAHGDGKVTRSRRRGMFGKAGQLEFTVESVTAVDGTRVPLRSSQQIAGKDNKQVVIVTTLLLSVLSVFVHGKDVELPAGTEVAAYVDHDTEVNAPGEAATSGIVRGEPEGTASIAKAIDGQHFAESADFALSLAVSPERKFLSARIYFDGREATIIERQLRSLTVSAGKLGMGEHTIEAEVQFTNGHIVRTAPVRIIVAAGST
jgi:hypothetical protein